MNTVSIKNSCPEPVVVRCDENLIRIEAGNVGMIQTENSEIKLSVCHVSHGRLEKAELIIPVNCELYLSDMSGDNYMEITEAHRHNGIENKMSGFKIDFSSPCSGISYNADGKEEMRELFEKRLKLKKRENIEAKILSSAIEIIPFVLLALLSLFFEPKIRTAYLCILSGIFFLINIIFDLSDRKSGKKDIIRQENDFNSSFEPEKLKLLFEKEPEPPSEFINKVNNLIVRLFK